MKVLVWPVAKYGCESWTLKKNHEAHLDAFEMKELRKIQWVSWTAKKTNEWVLNEEGTVRHCQSKETSNYGHIMRKQESCLEKEIMQGTTPGAHRQGRPGWTTLRRGQDSPWKSQSE